MRFIGIDPGLSGAVALLRSDGHAEVHDVPTVEARRGKKEIDLSALAHLVRDLRGAGSFEAAVELVGAMPGQGVTSMFNFGCSYGGIRGVLAGLSVPVTLVTPRKWMREMRVPSGKEGSVARASQLCPALASRFRGPRGGLEDGRAEAVLIAMWMRNKAQAAYAKDMLT